MIRRMRACLALGIFVATACQQQRCAKREDKCVRQIDLSMWLHASVLLVNNRASERSEERDGVARVSRSESRQTEMNERGPHSSRAVRSRLVYRD